MNTLSIQGILISFTGIGVKVANIGLPLIESILPDPREYAPSNDVEKALGVEEHHRRGIVWLYANVEQS